MNSILTERLLLRPPEISDAESIAGLMGPEVSRWLAHWPPVVDVAYATRQIVEAQDAIVAKRALHWVVTSRTDDSVMGWIRVSRSEATGDRGELGFWLGTAFHGMGFATEAARSVLPRAFEQLDLTVVEAGAQPENRGSLGVLQRLGMAPTGPRQVWAPTRQRHELCQYYELRREAPGR